MKWGTESGNTYSLARCPTCSEVASESSGAEIRAVGAAETAPVGATKVTTTAAATTAATTATKKKQQEQLQQ